MRDAFVGCNNLSIDDGAGTPDLSNVTDMRRMFFDASFNEDLSRWDVSKVTNMGGMFRASTFNGDLSKWNVSKVTNMNSMFFLTVFNGDLSRWDISNVTDMNNMFLLNTSMSSENYDKLLIGWSTLDTNAGETKIPSGITFSAPDKYSCRGKAGRDILTMKYNWSIAQDELIPIRTDAPSLSEVTAQCEVTKAELNA
ncbi:MAG: DUF285 domain-containing protein, partial [Ekhidna sp.]|nr:DUF285 domain-containing protein [Ekhidna sp.]